MRTNEVTVDERGRVSLARVRTMSHVKYTVEELPDGTMVWTPAVTVSALELAALRDPVVRQAVNAAGSPDRSKVVRRQRARNDH